MNPDQLAELEEERNFLLRSLVDLEREHAVGDVDEVDYHELKEGYTVRAAADAAGDRRRPDALPQKPTPNWKRRGLVAGGLVRRRARPVVGAGDVVGGTHAGPGDHPASTRGPNRQQLMAQARAIQFQSPGEAAALYDRSRRRTRTTSRR